MRQIALDTETTGLEPELGHRVIEIGCVEMVNRRPTGRRFHRYLNPDRAIDPGAVEVHGLDQAFLADKPRFAEVADELLAFVEGAQLVIHNAPFDLGFLNHELRLCGRDGVDLAELCPVLDTLTLARDMHPGQRNSLDALCKRYEVDNSRRSLHGALLDAQILIEVYLAMTGGQVALRLTAETDAAGEAPVSHRPVDRRGRRLTLRTAGADELDAHRQMLAHIDQTSGGRCLWRRAAADADTGEG